MVRVLIVRFGPAQPGEGWPLGLQPVVEGGVGRMVGREGPGRLHLPFLATPQPALLLGPALLRQVHHTQWPRLLSRPLPLSLLVPLDPALPLSAQELLRRRRAGRRSRSWRVVQVELV